MSLRDERCPGHALTTSGHAVNVEKTRRKSGSLTHLNVPEGFRHAYLFFPSSTRTFPRPLLPPPCLGKAFPTARISLISRLVMILSHTTTSCLGEPSGRAPASDTGVCSMGDAEAGGSA